MAGHSKWANITQKGRQTLAEKWDKDAEGGASRRRLGGEI